MRLRVVGIGLLTASLWAQTAPAREAQVITGRVFAAGHTMQYLTDLTDQFDPRLTGSPNYNAAAQWSDADKPLGPHLNRVAVENILKPKDLDGLLKSIGVGETECRPSCDRLSSWR
jgi:hypothetical protein